MTIFNVVYLTCGALGLALLAYKFRSLRTSWESPRLWALCAAVFFPSAAILFAAPANIGWVNRVTGVPNFAALLVYSLVVGFAGSAFALVLFWRYPTARAWRAVRWIVVGFGLAVVAMIVLFTNSSVPEERRVDFDTYYSDQPTVATFLAVYFVAALLGSAGQAYQCRQAARDEAIARRPWLRRGLRWYAVAALFPCGFAVVKIVVLIANRLGEHDLDRLSIAAPLISALGVFPMVVAVVLPVWGPRRPSPRRWLRTWRTFWRLRPLHRALVHVNPATVLVAPGRFLNPHHRVRRQIIELNDWRWTLTPYFDPAVRATALALGGQAGLSANDLKAVAEAAQLRAASLSAAQGPPPTMWSGATAQRDPEVAETSDGTEPTTEHERWIRIAKAFHHSPIVDAAMSTNGQVGAPVEGGEAHR